MAFRALGAAAPRPAAPGSGGYGPLRSAGPELALPEGFSYVVLGAEGSPLTSGEPTPRAHDGMAAFALPGGRVRLVRNHEVAEGADVAQAFGAPDRAYDRKGGGGTTTLEVALAGGAPRVVRSWVSLAGTVKNCAGGATPWGSWLSCEETLDGPSKGRERKHGYVFEVPASADAQVEPVPLVALGRFAHEAVGVDPATGILYLTEDNGPAGLYRFAPHVKGVLAAGKLQQLAVRGSPRLELWRGRAQGDTFDVEWVEIAEPDPASAETNPLAVFEQGAAKGAAHFLRLEGCFFSGGRLFFHSTSGGDAGLGQVWEYTPARGKLTLLYQPDRPEALRSPDNLVVSPRGGLVICEDSDASRLIGLTREGKVFELARSVLNGREFAGATYSPDGKVLFVNVQGDVKKSEGLGNRGMTFAIQGPWERGAV